MQADIKYLKKAQVLMSIAIATGVLSLVLSFAKDLAAKKWALDRDNVACIPADVEHSQPMVYRQTTMNPTEQDALLKEFVEHYIHFSQDEQIVDYHATTTNERYKDARLSNAKWAAIEMSEGIEKALNMKRYSTSNETFYTLKQGNMGWVFLIDDLMLFGIPHTGNILAVVRGEFQVTYDKVKSDLPAKLWGYREIHLILSQGVPEFNEKSDKYENKYGWYVTWSHTETLSPDQKDKLSARSNDYYLLQDIKNK